MSVNIVSMVKCVLHSKLTQNKYLKYSLFMREPLYITFHTVLLFFSLECKFLMVRYYCLYICLLP